MPSRFKSYEVTPSMGGKLLSAPSPDYISGVNYVKKTNWRREYNVEKLREGWTIFDPSGSERMFYPRPFPEDPNLIVQFTRPNGDKMTVIATPSSIYKLEYDFTPTEYFFENEDGYVDPGYLRPTAYEWVKIGDNFRPGNRWEACAIDGTLVLNNGVEIPQVYRMEWDSVRPLYELRELGVTSVGTIAAFSGYLIVADISEIAAEDMPALMNSESPYGWVDPDVYTINRVVYDIIWSVPAYAEQFVPLFPGRVNAVPPTFTTLSRSRSDDSVTLQLGNHHNYNVGDTVTVSGLGGTGYNGTFVLTRAQVDEIEYTSVGSDESTVSDTDGSVIQTFPAAVTTHRSRLNDVATLKFGAHTFKVGDKVAVASMTDATYNTPGAEVLSVTPDSISYGSTGTDESETADAAGSVTLVMESDVFILEYPVSSLSPGDTVMINGGGLEGGNITVALDTLSPSHLRWTLKDDCDSRTTLGMFRAVAVGSDSGRSSLKDDSSRIIKIAQLGEQMIVYRTTGYFLGSYSYSGSGDEPPFTFRPWYRGVDIPIYRHTICTVSGSYHMYLAKDGYFRVTTNARAPERIDTMNYASDFYKTLDMNDVEDVFAFVNENTQEVWFSLKDHTECYSYVYDDASTIDAAFSCATLIEKPQVDVYSPTEFWTLLVKDRIILRSGVGYLRINSSYLATLESGMFDFGSSLNEKKLRAYMLLLSQKSAISPITVSIYGSMTSSQEPDLLETGVFQDLSDRALMCLAYQQCYFKDKIEVTANGNDVRIVKRIFDYIPVASYGNPNRWQ